jgi:C-22 sterol desaturase
MISVMTTSLDAPAPADSRIVMYVYRKSSIAGSTLKMPFIGPFMDSVKPDFRKYHRQWMSGPLSCVSVFHKYVPLYPYHEITR